MSPIKNTVFLLLLFLPGLAGCSLVIIENAEQTPISIPISKVPPQPSPTNTVRASPVQPTPTRQVLDTIPSPSINGTLVIEIVYTGHWYRETFNYEPDAPNIRHMALVMPLEEEIILTASGWVFSSLTFTPSSESFALGEERIEYGPFLKYLFDAPGGTASIDLAPGKYKVAVAFIAAALPPPNDDAILYPGITGGGASNEFQEVVLAAGETRYISIELTDNNGWGWHNLLAMK